MTLLHSNFYILPTQMGTSQMLISILLHGVLVEDVGVEPLSVGPSDMCYRYTTSSLNEPQPCKADLCYGSKIVRELIQG